MALTHNKRIQNLDLPKPLYDQINDMVKAKRITRAQLLRILIRIALKHPNEIDEYITNPNLFES